LIDTFFKNSAPCTARLPVHPELAVENPFMQYTGKSALLQM